LPLLKQSISLNPSIEGFVDEQNWLRNAKRWGSIFVNRYGPEEVTPYIHCFVYHLGRIIEKYGSIEKYANYPIEACHQKNKKYYKGITKRYKNQTAKQLLQKNLRINYLTNK